MPSRGEGHNRPHGWPSSVGCGVNAIGNASGMVDHRQLGNGATPSRRQHGAGSLNVSGRRQPGLCARHVRFVMSGYCEGAPVEVR